MQKFLDYFMVLEVHYLASDEIIKASYKKLSQKYHPDTGGSKVKFMEISEAYETLSVPEKKSAYLKEWMTHFVHQPNLNIHEIKESLYDVTFYHIRSVMCKYLNFIKEGEFEDAYLMLSNHDRKTIFLKDFITWQKLITEIHHLLDFDCVIEDIMPRNKQGKSEIRVKVRVKEYNKLFNRIEEDFFIRQLIYESQQWRIKLNEIDVKMVIRKYKKILTMKKKHVKVLKKYLPKIDENHMTKLVSKRYFINNCEYEWLRYQRYKNPFSILSVQFKDPSLSSKLELIIRNETRALDSFCRYHDDCYFILLPETSKENGKIVANKISKEFTISNSQISFRISEANEKYSKIKEMLDRLRS